MISYDCNQFFALIYVAVEWDRCIEYRLSAHRNLLPSRTHEQAMETIHNRSVIGRTHRGFTLLKSIDTDLAHRDVGLKAHVLRKVQLMSRSVMPWRSQPNQLSGVQREKHGFRSNDIEVISITNPFVSDKSMSNQHQEQTALIYESPICSKHSCCQTSISGISECARDFHRQTDNTRNFPMFRELHFAEIGSYKIGHRGLGRFRERRKNDMKKSNESSALKLMINL
jgi:hypothetical protein